MLRALGIGGLGGLFLLISPKLRETVQESIGGVYMVVQSYAPFSYVLGVLLVITAMIVSFNQGSKPR
jgi:uncharacterized membrane protein (DUF106 family)